MFHIDWIMVKNRAHRWHTTHKKHTIKQHDFTLPLWCVIYGQQYSKYLWFILSHVCSVLCCVCAVWTASLRIIPRSLFIMDSRLTDMEATVGNYQFHTYGSMAVSIRILVDRWNRADICYSMRRRRDAYRPGGHHGDLPATLLLWRAVVKRPLHRVAAAKLVYL